MAAPPDAGVGRPVLFAPDEASKGGAGGTGGLSGSGTTTTVASTSPFVINVTWDSSVQSAPTGFTAGVLAAVQYMESQFTDAVTINIHVGYGEVGGSSLGSNALGSSESYLTSVSYAGLVGALTRDATSSADSSAVASLPAGSPVNGTYWTTTAEAKALGLLSANGTSVDGYVGFSSALPFDYNNADGVSGGTYDFNGVVLHEISEVMGRLMLTGTTIGTTSNSYDVLDLLHYAAAGVRDFSAATPGYFSVNGGVTNLGAFNTVAGGDAGDWASSMGSDAFDAFTSSGIVNTVSAADLLMLDAIGWNSATVTASSTPAGVALAAKTASLAALQAAGALAANIALASVTQVGGATGDSYGYSLGGAGAAAFTLSTAGSAATLSGGASGVAGGVNGRLYALTLTATDLTSGNASPAVPVDVIVGASGGDTISVATLSGSLSAATPSFVYGLGGNDTINATGMSGKLWIAGGAGADTMTGGSGVNDYLYGAASESTASAMDVISNFHAATDLIDLTGLGTALQYAGKIATTRLAAHSVGWQVTGSNTFVYVNTSGSTESVGGTNMQIELRGSISLATGNILHA